MKNLAIILLIATLAISLCACDTAINQSGETTTTAVVSDAADTTTITSTTTISTSTTVTTTTPTTKLHTETTTLDSQPVNEATLNLDLLSDIGLTHEEIEEKRGNITSAVGLDGGNGYIFEY